MKLKQIDQPNSSEFLIDYLAQKEELSTFFHSFASKESYESRASSLASHPVKRKELTKIIREYMADLPQNDYVDNHLNELEKNALVVIGGQQAGLLTGPMYSIHKAISIVILAKQQRDALGIPVVPVFWIAGEDHDLDEINSTFTPQNGRVQKHTYNDRPNRKLMASETLVETDKLQSFIRNVFKQFVETPYTKALLLKYMEMAEQVTTYSRFFALMMHDFFANEGLLLIDAAYEPLRQYESPYFVEMIEEAQQISTYVVEQENRFQEAGYGQPIQANINNANLFIVENGQRFLLKIQNGGFSNEAAGLYFTKEELLKIARNHPERLSNNVVTRPLMQEMVFPVLAFVGGPGELAYWATFKGMFEHFEMNLPVIVPRLSLTIIDQKSKQYLEELNISVEGVFNGELQSYKQDFMVDIKDEIANQLVQEIQQTLDKQYEKLANHLTMTGAGLEKLTEKNLKHHEKQINYLSRKIEDLNLLQNDVKIRKFNHIEGMLYPEFTLQERWYNPVMLLNDHGPSFVNELLSMPFEFNGKHKILTK